MARTSQSLPPLETVTITGLAYGGDGMAYDENGGTVFVPYGLPGDTVRVQVDNKSSSKGGGQVPKKWGKIVDVITPSPDRLEKPPCTHCFDCGGCALQHMQMQAYQDWKYNAVVDRLAKVGLVPERAHPLISIPAKSRRRATFAVARMGRRVVLGFNRHHSDQIVDLNECHVVVEPIINVLPGIRALMDVLLQNVRAADVSVAVLDYGLDVLVTGNIELDLMMREAIAEFVQTYHIARFSMRSSERAEAEVILAPKSAAVTVGGVPFVIPPGAFLQPSRAGEAALIDCVCQGVGDAAQVADLFCGMGTFSYPLGAVGKSVVGYDVSTLSPLPFRGRAGWGTK